MGEPIGRRPKNCIYKRRRFRAAHDLKIEAAVE